jgi:phospholipid N-methyltransferase
MKRLDFLSESLKNLKEVGTVTRSSRSLCRSIANQIDFEKADTIVELGAGDGVISVHLLKEMKPDSRLIVFEINEAFCHQLREIDDPRFLFYQRSAEDLEDILKELGIENIDYVVSALPFTVFSEKVAERIVEQCRKALKVSGKYIQVHYSLVKRNLYKKVFGNTRVNFVLKNLPPAFLIISLRGEDVASNGNDIG